MKATPPGSGSASASASATPVNELSAEAARLRRLIETQPSCLLRVALDGVLLAVNEAALCLLGAEGLAQTLGRPLTDHIENDHRSRWSEFAGRVRANGSASVECDLVQGSGDRRTVLLQGTAFLDHPDGVESVILVIRDTTASRRLEQALEDEGASRQSLEEARAKLQWSLAEQQRLEDALADTQVERQRLENELAERKSERGQLDAERRAEQQRLEDALADTQAERQRLENELAERNSERGQLDAQRRTELAKLQQLVEQQQLALIEKEREHRQLVSALQAQLAEAVAEQTNLSRALEERGAERDRLEDNWTAVRAELEQTLHDERRQVAVSKERSHQKLVDLESRLSASVAEHARLAGLLDQQRRLEAGRADARAELEQSLAETRAELERALIEAREQVDHRNAAHDQAIADLEAQVSHAVGEQTRLTSLLEDRDREQRRLEAGRAAARAELERSLAETRAELERALIEAREQVDHRNAAHDQAIADLEAQASHAVGEQTRLTSLLKDRDRDRQRLEAKHAEVHTKLERALADARDQVKHRSEREQQEVAELEVQLSRAVAEQTRLAALLAARDTERHRLEADHAAVRSRLEQLRAEESELAHQQHDRLRRELTDLHSRYDQTLAERDRLAALVERHDVERPRIDAELASARAEIERLTREHEHALLIREHEQRELIANLQAELALSMAVQKRAETELMRSEANQKRLVAEYAADRAQAERALGDAIIKKNQILKVLADQRVEVQQVSENARALEPLAAAGRLAVDVGRELQELTTEIEARAKFLLSLCELETSYRSELETLRAETVRAASLARQFALTNLRQPTINFEDDVNIEVPAVKPKESEEIA